MHFQDVIDQLRSELNRIDQAISVFQSLGASAKGRRRGRPPGSKNHLAATTPKRRTMSASARALISAAQKARWAKQKKASPGTAANKSTGRRVMSPAARKRISVAMKKRWAQGKKSS